MKFVAIFCMCVAVASAKPFWCNYVPSQPPCVTSTNGLADYDSYAYQQESANYLPIQYAQPSQATYYSNQQVSSYPSVRSQSLSLQNSGVNRVVSGHGLGQGYIQTGEGYGQLGQGYVLYPAGYSTYTQSRGLEGQYDQNQYGQKTGSLNGIHYSGQYRIQKPIDAKQSIRYY